MELYPPILQALAWRLVGRDIMARESLPGDGPDAERAWVLRRLAEGPHGLPYQLACDAWAEAIERAPHPLDGLSLISEATLRLEQCVPRVVNEEGWDQVCRIVDPELLALAHPRILLLDPADRETASRLTWPPVLRAHQTVFHASCVEDLAEVHAHLGGSLPNAVLWSLLVAGVLPPECLAPPDTEEGGDSPWAAMILETRKSLGKIAGLDSDRLGAALTAGLAFDQDIDPLRWPFQGATINQSATLALLLPERVLLHRALWCYRRKQLPPDGVSLLADLVRRRCAFNALLSQGPGHRGLVRFLSYYERRSALWRRPFSGATSRVAQVDPAQTLGFELLFESWLADREEGGVRRPGLDLELRTSLPLRGRETIDLFQAMARGLLRVLRRHVCPGLRVGLVHHTIKLPGRADGSTALDEFQRVWYLLQANPDLRPLLVGLDAAAVELACPPRTFSAAFAWVREQLDGEPVVGAPIRLGFTFHAGEDFRDLLTGIRHVDEAAHLLAMRPGDRLGHALALSWPVEDFFIARQSAFPTIGDHALDLCWAAALLSRHEGLGEQARDARDRLVDLLTQVGATARRPLPSIVAAWDLNQPHPWASPLSSVLDHRRTDDRGPPEVPRALREDELLDLLGIPEVKRDRIGPRPPRPRAWQVLVDSCQRLVQDRVLEKGLVIEINPSSNRMVGGFSSIDRLPYTRLSRPGPRAPGQRANLPLAIGTDDAGIFHTSLRREYEMVGQSALAQGYSLPDVHAWLDEIRRTGRRASFLSPYGRTGPELVALLERIAGGTVDDLS